MSPPNTRTTSTRGFSNVDIQMLKRLPRILAREGYSDAYSSYGQFNLRTTDWARDLHLLPDHLQTLFRLFLLSEAVPRRKLKKIFREDELTAYERLSVIVSRNGSVSTLNLILIPASGYLFFAQRPSVNPVAYFGDDSGAFAIHLAPSVGDKCLDLCTGPGIQALLCSRVAGNVVAVDVNPVAAGHAELNVAMNDLEDRIEVRVGDLYEAVAGMQFDFICANPPLLPFPPDLPYPFVGHGGGDGLEIARRILKGLPNALKPGGLCQVIGTCLGDWDGPHFEKEIGDLASQHGWRVRITVPGVAALVPDSSTFKGLAWTCATAADLDINKVSEQVQAHLNQLDATHLYPYFLTVSTADDRPSITVTRHYRERTGFWFI